MTKLFATVRAFVKGDEGATATEYAILLALIAAVIIVAVGFMGEKIETVFTNVEGRVPDGN